MSEIFVRENLFAGDFSLVTEEPVTLLAGQGIVKRGTALGKITASSKLKILNSTNTDGSQAIYGILGTDTDTTAGDANNFVYLTGEFNQAAIVFGGTDTYLTHKDDARIKGIFFKAIQP